MIITLLVDNPDSWIVPYVQRLQYELNMMGHEAILVHSISDIKKGECAFFLGCEKIISKDVLKRNKHNLVVHESAVPQGKGWSPLTWQILEGKNSITITLFEAAESVDSGEIYLQDTLHFKGHELNGELKHAQGDATVQLITKFIKMYPNLPGKQQVGDSTFYPRRKLKDSELDVNKTIAEQFDLLRVVDNEQYPAFFSYRGNTYVVKIYKRNVEESK